SELASDCGIELSTAPFEFPGPAAEHRHWQVGDSVVFGDGRREKRGQVVRVNRKTCTVTVSQHARILRYRVPLSLLRRAAAA
ncbi:MAG: hypothetical protein VX671_04475, partial [Pseudomonadota bacterium]|nr:hypothetical protein [Pseudomonadota bacterium]